MITKQKATSVHSTLPKAAQRELRVFHLIHENRDISRIGLVERTGYSAASMSAIVHRLIDKGMVIESGKGSNSFGRKPVSLSLRGDLAYVVGVDVGSFLLRVVVTDINGGVHCQTETETRMGEGRERVLSRTFHTIHEVIRQSQVPKRVIKGIGVAHSGVIDSRQGLVLSFPRPGQMTEWKNVPLRDMIASEFRVSVVLDDSVRTMAVAERYFGLGANVSDFLYVAVGMGIGAGLFIDGKLYRGPGGSAGEFGHMTVDENGPMCSCGNNGCLEVLASCAAIIRAVRTAIENGVSSKVSELVEGNLDRTSIEVIIQAANQNDSLAFRMLHEAVSHIGVALADVVNLLNPKLVIFGGPLFRQGHRLLLEPLQRIIRQRALEKSANDAQFMISSLGSEAGALGAAKLVSKKVLKSIYAESL